MVALPLVFGLLVGSFLNVVIARVPEGRSVWAPRLGLPRMRGADRLVRQYPAPVVPRAARALPRLPRWHPWRYPIVEAATGSAFALAYALFGPTPGFLVAAVLLGALIAITAIDLRHQIIPDVISLPGIVVACHREQPPPGGVGWLDSLIGIAVGGGIFLVIILVSGGGMGGGDMKLGAMLGAFLGWKLGLLALLLGVLAGGAVAVVLLLLGPQGQEGRHPVRSVSGSRRCGRAALGRPCSHVVSQPLLAATRRRATSQQRQTARHLGDASRFRSPTQRLIRDESRLQGTVSRGRSNFPDEQNLALPQKGMAPFLLESLLRSR